MVLLERQFISFLRFPVHISSLWSGSRGDKLDDHKHLMAQSVLICFPLK